MYGRRRRYGRRRYGRRRRSVRARATVVNIFLGSKKKRTSRYGRSRRRSYGRRRKRRGLSLSQRRVNRYNKLRRRKSDFVSQVSAGIQSMWK